MSQVGGSKQTQAAPMVLHTPKPVKVHPPDVFEGKRGTVEAFLMQLELYYGFHTQQLTAHVDKILFACSYMRGAAFEWAQGYVEDYLKHPGVTNEDRREEMDELFKAYTSFEKELRAIFGNPNRVQEAERQLGNLRQTGSVADYVAEFRKLEARVDWDDAAKKARFYEGLKNYIKDAMLQVDPPKTLIKLIELAIRIDNRYNERTMEKRTFGNISSFVQYRKRQSMPRKDPYGLRPMEVDLLAKDNSNQEKQRRTNEKLCLNCGKPGHYIRDCQQKQTNGKGKKNFHKKEKRFKYKTKTIRVLEGKDQWEHNSEQWYKDNDIKEYYDPNGKEEQMGLESEFEESQQDPLRDDMLKGKEISIDLTTDETATAMDAILKGIEEINAIINSIDESFDSTDTDEQEGRRHKRPQ